MCDVRLIAGSHRFSRVFHRLESKKEINVDMLEQPFGARSNLSVLSFVSTVLLRLAHLLPPRQFALSNFKCNEQGRETTADFGPWEGEEVWLQFEIVQVHT